MERQGIMRLSDSHIMNIELEDDEITIFGELIRKIKETPVKIGFSRKTFSEAEQSVIDGLYNTMGYKANEVEVNVEAEKDTVR